MKLKVIIHKPEERSCWAEVPAIPGCFSQGDTWDELIQNIYEAIEGCLEVGMKDIELKPEDKVIELAV